MQLVFLVFECFFSFQFGSVLVYRRASKAELYGVGAAPKSERYHLKTCTFTTTIARFAATFSRRLT